MVFSKQIQGLVAATCTPMVEGGEVELSVVPAYVDHLVRMNNGPMSASVVQAFSGISGMPLKIELKREDPANTVMMSTIIPDLRAFRI